MVQGWSTADYLRCVQRYQQAGVDLAAEPLVGLGSVCRRQGGGQAAQIVTELRAAGVARLHGFGVKTCGLARYGHLLASADSLAWSYDARRATPLAGCVGRHRNCANCLPYALAWRERLLARLARPRPVQLPLWPDTAPELAPPGGAADAETGANQ